LKTVRTTLAILLFTAIIFRVWASNRVSAERDSREKERQRQRTETETEKEAERDRDRDRKTETETERGHTQRDRDRQREQGVTHHHHVPAEPFAGYRRLSLHFVAVQDLHSKE
jgi:hypothetical protein